MKKIMPIVLIVVVAVFLFSGCGRLKDKAQQRTAQNNPSTAQQADIAEANAEMTPQEAEEIEEIAELEELTELQELAELEELSELAELEELEYLAELAELEALLDEMDAMLED